MGIESWLTLMSKLNVLKSGLLTLGHPMNFKCANHKKSHMFCEKKHQQTSMWNANAISDHGLAKTRVWFPEFHLVQSVDVQNPILVNMSKNVTVLNHDGSIHPQLIRGISTIDKMFVANPTSMELNPPIQNAQSSTDLDTYCLKTFFCFMTTNSTISPWT